MHLQTDEVSRRIGNDVPLASLDFLASIIATEAATLRRFHGLAVNDACGRARFASLVLARRDDERVVDRQPRPITRPRVEIPLERSSIAETLLKAAATGNPSKQCRTAHSPDRAYLSCAGVQSNSQQE